tara:strand:- start:49818 stop:50396 length:579 start_codon:yes stop_codon:yes gene_type:complete
MSLNIFNFSFVKEKIRERELKKLQANEEHKKIRREENLKRYFIIKSIKEKWKNKDYKVVNEAFHHYSFNIDNIEHVYGISGIVDFIDLNLHSEEEFYRLLCLDHLDSKELKEIGISIPVTSEGLLLELRHNDKFSNINQLWLHIYKESLKERSLYIAFYNAMKLFSPEQFDKLNNNESFIHYTKINKSMNDF